MIRSTTFARHELTGPALGIDGELHQAAERGHPRSDDGASDPVTAPNNTDVAASEKYRPRGTHTDADPGRVPSRAVRHVPIVRLASSDRAKIPDQNALDRAAPPTCMRRVLGNSSHGWMSSEGGRSDGEADRSGAGVKALVPDHDREICRAECECAGEMHGVGPAELMSGCKRAGSLLDVG